MRRLFNKIVIFSLLFCVFISFKGFSQDAEREIFTAQGKVLYCNASSKHLLIFWEIKGAKNEPKEYVEEFRLTRETKIQGRGSLWQVRKGDEVSVKYYKIWIGVVYDAVATEVIVTKQVKNK